MLRRSLALLVFFVTVPTLAAQVTPRTITGIVRDASGRPLEDAVVALDPSGYSRATRADAQGRFRFDRVAPGSHELRTTWLGYSPDERAIDVPAAGLTITITLEQLPYQLDTLPITARRTGIFGTAIVRQDFRALGGADVTVMGTTSKTRTGSNGKFEFSGLREGAYVVLGKRLGFKTRILPVPVPPNEAVEIALVLDSIMTKAEKVEQNLYFELERRWNRRSAPNSALVPRHELAARRGQKLDVALRYAPSFLHKALLIKNDECVFVDGKPAHGMRVKDFHADDVAMVEVYGSGGGGAMHADRAILRSQGIMDCGAFSGMGEADAGIGSLRYVRRPQFGVVSFVYIWLKH